MDTQQDPRQGKSIGAVARETGINSETIRMWERRYGAPQSMRLPSGHRRYSQEEIDRLRLVKRVLERGHRPRHVVTSPRERLLQLLDEGEGGSDGSSPHGRLVGDFLTTWCQAALAMDGSRLMALLHDSWTELGPLRFIEDRCEPFIRQVGDGWCAGEISVAQEHFVSGLLSDFLTSHWRRLSERAPGGPFLLAGLPGDLHQLGLLLCASVTALADHRVIYLGGHTPPEEIVETAEQQRPSAVCLSISNTVDRSKARRWVAELRRELPDEIPLVIGGRGAPQPESDSVLQFSTFRDYHDWALRQP